LVDKVVEKYRNKRIEELNPYEISKALIAESWSEKFRTPVYAELQGQLHKSIGLYNPKLFETITGVADTNPKEDFFNESNPVFIKLNPAQNITSNEEAQKNRDENKKLVEERIKKIGQNVKSNEEYIVKLQTEFLLNYIPPNGKSLAHTLWMLGRSGYAAATCGDYLFSDMALQQQLILMTRKDVVKPEISHKAWALGYLLYNVASLRTKNLF